MSTLEREAVEMVGIEVDGQPMQVPKNSMIIEATDRAGIEVPRFCYHEKLSIAANCRMCLVDVEKAPKPLPACATPVMDGMKIFTRSRRAIDAQHGVMEFLLINHPLDCPICDQGGECELQDLAMGYGRSVSRFTERKRVVKDKNVGSLVKTDMTRCIHCTRCVRFLDEIAGTQEMGGSGRGDRLEIGTCIERSIDSELSGNVIDLCPVGALTNKPFRFSARAWELMAKPAQSAHDAVCSELYYHNRRGQILRAVPKKNEARNETWLSDRDRYSHFGLQAADRLLAPQIRVDGKWQTASWSDAITAAASALKEAGSSLKALFGASSSTEEYFLGQRMTRALGSPNIDHRLRECDFSDDPVRASKPLFGMSVAEISCADAVLLVGSHIRHEAPIIGHRVRQAWRAGGKIMGLNPVAWPSHFDFEHALTAAPQELLGELLAIAGAVFRESKQALPGGIADSVAETPGNETHEAIAAQLAAAERGLVMVGQFAHIHPQAAAIRQVAAYIASATGQALNILPFGGNPVGAYRAGAIPQAGPGGNTVSPGQSALEMMREPGAFLIWDFEPEFDTFDPEALIASLAESNSVVAVCSFASPALLEHADVLLPLAPIAESEGSLHNIDGEVKTFSAAGSVSGESRPGWKILRRLGAELGLEGFDQIDLHDVQADMAQALEGVPENADWNAAIAPMKGSMYRAGEIPMYAADALCRRSAPLQDSTHADCAFAGLNPADCQALGLVDGDLARISRNTTAVDLPIRQLSAVAPGSVWLAGATQETWSLGPLVAEINVERAE